MNWGVAVAKIVVGLVVGRITIIADGLHSLLDGINNVIGIVAIAMAAKPPDENHPYGHRKFENVAAMFIGGLIVLIAWEIGGHVVRTFWHRWQAGDWQSLAEGPTLDWLFALVLLATMSCNVVVALYERRHGERLSSVLLKADAAHTMSDTLVTGFSLASLFLGSLIWWADPLLACGVLYFLARTAWGIISENLPAFTDRALLDPSDIRRIAMSVEGVQGTHRVRSHGALNDVHLDLNIVVAEDLTAAQVEEIERAVRQALRDAFPGLTLIGIHHRTEGSST